MAEPIRSFDARWAFSHRSQTNFATALAAADLTRSIALNAPDVAEYSNLRAGAVPKPFTGDNWPRLAEQRETLRDVRLTRTADADSLILPWLVGFLMGAVTTTNPDVGVRWSHAFRFQNPVTSKQPPATTIYEELAAAPGIKRLIRSLCVNEVSISGARGAGLAQVAASLIGAGAEDTATAVTLPALAFGKLFASADAVIEYGPKGGALVDISSRVREWAVRLSNNLDADGGYTVGSGKFRSRLWLSRQAVSAELVVEVDQANRDLLNDLLPASGDLVSQKELKITLKSNVTLATGQYQAVIRIPDCALTAAPLAYDGEFGVYRVSIAEEQVGKDAAVADSPITITVDNNITAYFTAA